MHHLVLPPLLEGALTVYQGDDYQYVDANGNNLALVNPSYNGNPTYQSNGLIIHPKTPDVSPLIAHINLIQTCVFAYKQMFNYDIRPYFVRTTGGASISQPVLSAPGVANVADAVAFYGPGDFHVYFGRHSVADYDKLAGNVRPYCGSMIFSYKNFTLPQLQTSLAGAYYETVLSMFSNASPLTPSPNSNGRLSQAFGYKAVAHKLFNKGPVQPVPVGCPPSPPLIVPAFDFSAIGPCADGQLSPNHRAFSSSEFTRTFNIIIDNAISGLMAIAPSPFAVSAVDLNRGWATAGIWYNKLSEWNGDVITGVAALPLLDKYPEVMETTKSYKISANPNTDPLGIFKPIADGTGNVQYENENSRQIATVLNDAYDYWNADGAGDIRSVASKANPLEGGLAAIFGLTPILTIRDQDHVHPLAQLAGIGRTLIENAITNLTLAAGASFMAGTLGAANNSMSYAFSGMSGFFVALSFVGILLGVVLFYILPFMPFLYTFFAVSGWIKSIFEGMVGVPLWALSHLKIKGDGLLSREATAGYYLLLEIFIRPTLILFGLVASTAIFAASVTVLNSVFDLVTDQITGVGLQQATINNPLTMGYYRNNVDQFFFLVMYIIIVYLMGTSAFKLVDQIPHSVIRWVNAGVKSFGDMAKDPAEGLYQYASMATYRFGPKIGQGIAGASEALGESVGGATGLAEVFKPGSLPGMGSLSGRLPGNIGKGSVE
ncbi:MAG: DotA/TraY family protein [Alphaproteobacteria bacterium]|nr:DotA/TraY family protein [Alphaproteobacteria bacterium]